jgi:gamma-glutamyl-gamma-aminobutyraldehyde dehydrogenase
MINLSFQEWETKASELKFRNQAFINGKFVNSVSGKTLSSINPATGEL